MFEGESSNVNGISIGLCSVRGRSSPGVAEASISKHWKCSSSSNNFHTRFYTHNNGGHGDENKGDQVASNRELGRWLVAHLHTLASAAPTWSLLLPVPCAGREARRDTPAVGYGCSCPTTAIPLHLYPWKQPCSITSARKEKGKGDPKPSRRHWFRSKAGRKLSRNSATRASPVLTDT
jgi:hypothetical protein